MLRRYCIPLTCVCLMLVLIFFPATAMSGASSALNSWFVTVLPCLAPFFFLSGLITAYMSRKRGFKSITRAYAFVTCMCIMSGYPMSARLCSSLYENKMLGSDAARRLACVCSVTGPAFFVSGVSASMLGSAQLCLYLLPAHYASSLILMAVLQRAKPVHIGGFSTQNPKAPSLGGAMLKSCTDTCTALLGICVFMVTFGALLSVANSLLNGFSLLSGLFEMTTGSLYVSTLQMSLEVKLVLISFICSFAGLCIHAQSHSLFSECGLRLKGFFLVKLTQGILSGALTFALLKLLPIT